jgi:alpha-glucoside transport system substrate-binding protein
VYDDWVSHRVTFSDDAIVDAVARFGAIALSPDKVAGGNRAAVELTIEESARQLLEQPTRCVLHRQASFMPRLLGRSDLVVAPDGDLWAFPMPAVDGGEAPLVVGGTVTVRFSDADDVDQLARYLTTGDAATRRADRGGFVSARSTVALDRYSSTLDRFVAELLLEADVVRFDASDLMPPEVGVGTFWTGMTSWLGGARLRSVLADIDASWPVELTKPAVPFDAGLDAEADAEADAGGTDD